MTTAFALQTPISIHHTCSLTWNTLSLSCSRKLIAFQVLAYGVRHGLDHARRAVEEAEHAIYTLRDGDGQVAYLLALAKRTLLVIEEQHATMKDYQYLSDIEEEDEEEGDDVGRSPEVKEVPMEFVIKMEGKEAEIPETPAVINNKPGLSTWNSKSIKDSKRSAPEQP